MTDCSTAGHGRNCYTPKIAPGSWENRRFAVGEQSQLGRSFGALSRIMPQIPLIRASIVFDVEDRTMMSLGMRASGADADMFYVSAERSKKCGFR
jgi:hypothetical protein